MDDQTKAVTLDKAQSVINEVGYADWILEKRKIQEFYQEVSQVR